MSLPDLNLELLLAINRLIGKSPLLDQAMAFLSGLHLIKMAPLVVVLWYFWFDRPKETREKVIATLTGAFAAMFIARALNHLLPFNPRPYLRARELSLNLVSSMPGDQVQHWSSMPSDHAAIGFALAFGIFLIERRSGLLALLHVSALICFPRVYLALHYPQDILLGAVIGLACCLGALKLSSSRRLTSLAMSISENRPAYFYPALFFISLQFSTMLNDLRQLGSFLRSQLLGL